MPTKVLKDAGYVLRRDWQWTPPKPDHMPTDREISAVHYMIDEWDYGPIFYEKT